MPLDASTARVISSSSSNQTAMAASAALCQVWRLDIPSSNSPMRLAASSATDPDAVGDVVGQQAAFPQQGGRREVVA